MVNDQKLLVFSCPTVTAYLLLSAYKNDIYHIIVKLTLPNLI